MVYMFWKKHNVLLELSAEQLESGNHEKAKKLQETAKTTAKIIDVLVNNSEMSQKIQLKVL